MPIRPKTFITIARVLRFNPYGFRFLCTHSSAAPNPLLVKYLVDSLGFSKEEATTTSAKVISRKAPKNPHLLLNFMKQTGLDQTQMKELVLKVPALLYNDVNKTLQPKFHWLLKEIGLSVSDLVSVVAKDKDIIRRGLDTHLRPRYDCLRTILGNNEDVVKVIKRCSWSLTFGAHKTVTANVLAMHHFGLSDDQIKKLVFRKPSFIHQMPDKVVDILHTVEKDFGVPRASTMFVYGVDVLFSLNKTKLVMKMEIFKSFGWSDEQVLKLFSKMPYCFNQSEARIEKGLSFFTKELGCNPAYLITNPSILAYSLDKRVLPRVEVLKILDHKKVVKKKLSLFKVLCVPESKFIENFVLPYKDQIPDLYESYLRKLSQ